jgi:hypothetical protein
MALHKIIEYVSNDDLWLDENEDDRLPVYEQDKDFETLNDLAFEDQDFLMLFKPNLARFLLGPRGRQVSSRSHKWLSFLPINLEPEFVAQAVADMDIVFLHPSEWFISFQQSRQTDHVHPEAAGAAGVKGSENAAKSVAPSPVAAKNKVRTHRRRSSAEIPVDSTVEPPLKRRAARTALEKKASAPPKALPAEALQMPKSIVGVPTPPSPAGGSQNGSRVQSDTALAQGQAKLRGTNPGARHGARWLPAEDDALARMHKAGRSVGEMGHSFGRSDGGVRSRLKLLGLTK